MTIPAASPCWICGDPAPGTKEHRAKASDLRTLFDKVSQADPLYLHTDRRRNVKVGSIKSAALKFQQRICARCNSARTQPHDRAWEHLSAQLHRGAPEFQPGRAFRANSIFPYDSRRGMRNVHLYFAKLFGCSIVEGNLPIDIAPFAAAIMSDRPHPNLYLAFGSLPMPVKLAGASDIKTAEFEGQVAFATWFYQVGDLAVNVMYAVDGERREGLRHAWHPKRSIKRLMFHGFAT